MKKLLLAAFLLSFAFTTTFAQVASDLEGKWTRKVKTDEGETTQVLELKGSTFTFKINGSDGKLRFLAKGKAKSEKLGKLSTITFSGLEWGMSEDDLQASNDDRVDLYTLRNGQLIIASNFDKERDGEEPAAEVFTRAK